jgi:hypothetical protein
MRVRESREPYCRAEKNPRAEAVVTGNQFTEMAPPKETTPIPKKSRTRAQTVEPEVEETLGASSSEPRFPRDYIPPRKDDAPPVTLQKTPYYKLVMPDIPDGVIMDEDMLGRVSQLKYADHDITDMMKVP